MRGRPRLAFAVVGALAACQRAPDPEPNPGGGAFDVSAPPTAAVESRSVKPEIPIEEVARYPQPGTSIPDAIAFSPDGQHVTYLHSPANSLVRELYVHAPGEARRVLFAPPEGGATESNLSREEKLVRERLRIRSLGVTQYAWAPEGDELLVPLRGDLWVQRGLEGEPIKVVDGQGKPAMLARFSEDGDQIAYVWDGELYVTSSEGGPARQLTKGARGQGMTHGVPEYIAQEEMDRHRGFWWSLDGKEIAYTEVDERHIPAYRIEHQGKDEPQHEDHGYPFAGKRNAVVRLEVVRVADGSIRRLDLNQTGIAPADDPDDFYLARVHWLPGGDLLVELENRTQDRLDVVRFDREGKATLVLQERSDVWINLHHLFAVLDESEGELAGGFIRAHERDGFRHLYLYDGAGRELRALTRGPWLVDGLVGVDESRGLVYFTGTRDGPTEKHLYRVSLAGGPIERLTEAAGMHEVVMDRAHERFVDTHSSVDAPPRISVRRAADGAHVADLPVEPDPRVEELALRPPELVTLESRDGVTLHGALYRPDGEGPFPTIVSVYGGPHAQRVQNAWSLTADMRAQYLRSQGFLVWKLDNRGSARRGLAFEGAIRHELGDLEIRDQVDGVRWLVERGFADPERVGVYGWSYGGYLSAMALARAPETFKVAVAGAPVTHWDGYDTHYTERYMGLPADNAEGYRRSSVMAHVDQIEGKLMLVHGLIDENVHFRHTARLVNALIAADKDYTLLLFPDERHMPRSEGDRLYMERRIRDFFVEHL